MEIPETTDRIRFRPYRRDDARFVSNMFRDAQAGRFYPGMSDPEKADGWIEWIMDSYITHGFWLWVIEHRDQGWFLGDCGLSYQLVEGRRWLEVGYHLSAQFRGKGYATEAARACVTHAFSQVAAQRVCSIVDPTNTPSSRVASRIHNSSRVLTDVGTGVRLLFWSGVWPNGTEDP